MQSISRRDFIKIGSAGIFIASGLAGFPISVLSKPSKLSLGLHLFMVREELARDMQGTLGQLAAIGYEEVEYRAFAEWPAAEFSKAVKDAGLRYPSAGFWGSDLKNDIDACIDYAVAVGADYITLDTPTVADSNRQLSLDFEGDLSELIAAYAQYLNSFTLDDWKWNADFLNRIGSRINEAGLRLAYHNKCVEFKRFGDQTAYELLLSSTDPEFVAFELDCGWTQHAGFNPSDFIKKYPDRMKMLHLKEPISGPSTDIDIETTELGAGIIDWRGLLADAGNAGVEHYFVEHEPPFKIPPLDSAKNSYQYLQGLEIEGIY